MKNRYWSTLFATLAFALLGFAATAADATYRWTGAAGPDGDGVYDFLDKGNWTRTAGSDFWPLSSTGSITASGKSYDLNLVATDAELRIKMPSGAIYWKGTLKIADGGKYRFVGTDMAATQKFNIITLGAAAALTLETVDLELVNNALTVPSDASLTLIGATMRAPSTSNYSSSFRGTLALKAGSLFDLSGNFYCEQGGIFLVEGKSTLYIRKVFSLCTGTNGEPSELTIDDSAVIGGTTVNFCSRGVTGGNVYFKGQSPLFLAKSSFGCSSTGGVVCNFNFDIPAGGYAMAPIVVGDSGTSNKFPNNGNPTVVIDGKSAAFASDTDGTFPLIASAGAQIKNLGQNNVNAWVLTAALPDGAPDGAEAKWQYSGEKASLESAYPFTPTLPEITWADSKPSATCIVGVYVKGVPPPPEHDAPTFAEDPLALTGGADGASFAVEVSVAAFDEAFVPGGNDTATAYMRYRIKDSGAEWAESAESPIDAVTMKAQLSATVPKVSADTVYEVEVYTKHVIGGGTSVSPTPATGVVTVSKPPTTLPDFGETALVTKADGVTPTAITVTADVATLGDGASGATVKLLVRENGSPDEGAVADTEEIAAAGTVDLTAEGLEPGGAYELWVEVTNDAGKSIVCGKIVVATPPVFGALAADGAAGDTLVVTGLLNWAGSVTVEVSTTENFAAVCAERTAASVATGAAFALTFHAEKGAADYIAPGTTYFVRAISTQGAHAVTSAVMQVTTAGASGVTVTGYTHANGTVTITGRVEPFGAGTSTVHILWGNDGMNFPNDETIVRNASTGPDWTFTKTGYTDFFCYKVYVENSCPTESWATTPVLGKGSETPADITDTFYWKADAGGNWSGDWEDPAHWDACDSSGNPITTFHADFPDQTESFKKFSFSRIPEGAEVTVNLPARAMSWGTADDIGRANATLVFKGTPNKTVITFSSTGERHMELAGEKIVLDGLSLTFPTDLRMRNVNQTLEIRNKANVLFKAFNQSLHLQNCGTVGLGSTLIVDNATLDMTHGDGAGSSNAIFLSEGGKETTPVRIVVRGKNPQLLLAGVFNGTATSGATKMKQQIVFEVPEGGYADTPVKGIDVNKFGYRANSRSYDGIEILVDRASPALLRPFTPQTVTQDLIFWDGGIDTATALLDGGGANVELPAKNLMKCHYNDATSPNKVQVDFWCLASKGTVFVIYGKEEK